MRNLDWAKAILFFALGLYLASSVYASMVGQDPGRQRAGREDVEGLMQAYVISKLQDSLSLTDEQFAQMVTAQKALSEHRRRYRREKSETLKQIRQALRASAGQNEELSSLLERLDELQRDFEAQQHEDYAALDAILDIPQRARYRLLEQEIQRRFQQMVLEIRGRQQPRERRPQEEQIL